MLDWNILHIESIVKPGNCGKADASREPQPGFVFGFADSFCKEV
jgi:hypothetical protein